MISWEVKLICPDLITMVDFAKQKPLSKETNIVKFIKK